MNEIRPFLECRGVPQISRSLQSRRPRVRVASALGLIAAFALCAPSAAQVSLSQVPLLTSQPPPPNVMLTIDDSGSMAWAYVPDFIGNQYSNTAAYASYSYNRLYYNPTTSYPVPYGPTSTPGVLAVLAVAGFPNAYIDGFNPDPGTTVNLSTGYQPTLSLSYSGGAASQQFAGVPIVNTPGNYVPGMAFYYVYSGGTGCTMPDPTLPPPPDSCFTLVPVTSSSGTGGSDERQNFANWYSFYRTRHLSIISAAAQAMEDPTLASVRIAWQALDSCTDFSGSNCTGWKGANFDNRIRTFQNSHVTDFYNWLFQLPAANSTPTRVAWWRAGQYFSDTTLGANGPYGVDPNQSPTVSPGVELSCVNNFNVTLTDGLWNTMNEGGQTGFCGIGGTQASCGDADSTTTKFPDHTRYNPSLTASSTAIYGDGADGGDSDLQPQLGGLADIAFYYWSTNLRPDLTNFYVPPYWSDKSTLNPVTAAADATWPYWNSNNDPATWPHLVNFTVGVGLGGFLSVPGLLWSGDAHSGAAYSNLLNAAPNCGPTGGVTCVWPQVDPNASGGGFTGAGSTAGNGNVYDLWHAAIDSRGNAFSASSPLDLVNAMYSIIHRVEGQTVGNSAAAGSSYSLSATTQLIVASYDGFDWHGTVTSYAINSTTGAVGSTPAWQTDAATIACAAPTTSGAFTIACPTRPVFTSSGVPAANGTGMSASPGIPFDAPNLNSNNLLSLVNTPLAAPATVVNYLRGDTSNEQRNGGVLRNRGLSYNPTTGLPQGEIVLGDMVDSNPIYSWQENFGYDVLPSPEGQGNYGTFVASKATARKPMVYVGANDGMVHGFDASGTLNSVGVADGPEAFAYVPHSVVANLASLANPQYLHDFYVDGPVFVGDAYFAPAGTSGGASWHSVLLGATGAGGRGIFALDVTTPQSFASSSVLWDMDATAAAPSGDPNLGFTIGQPIIARLNSGDWAAVFGNGYNSTRLCAVLYIVRISDGTVLRTIDTSGSSSACPATNGGNGLGTPTLLDYDQNGTIDYVYAGDLQGNLWKFDLTDPSPANWKVAFPTTLPGHQPTVPAPLFTAVNAAGVPQPIVAAPNLGSSPANSSAVMVYFVTGKMFATGDPTDMSTQSVYAVQDQGSPITGARGSNGMVQQTVTATGVDETVSQNSVTLATQNGWYIDLPGAGERALSEPLLAGSVLMFSSVIPSTQPCSGGCGGYIYAVKSASGNGGTGFLIAANGTSYDAIPTGVGCIKGLTLVTKGSTFFWYASGNGNGAGSAGIPTNAPGNTGNLPNFGGAPSSNAIQQGTGTIPPGTVPNGRVSWHEVVQ